MELLNNILKLFAGVGLFIFAMYLLEESLKNLSGRKFKIFLQKNSKNKITAVFGGALITAILQSSSMVSLMVLAFVGAGVFSMKNAMAIILGANLGTTFTSWMIATVGFKLNFEIIAYPAVCIGGLLLIIFKNKSNFKYISYFLLGFGMIFIALSFMKNSMEIYVREIDLSAFTELPKIVFLIFGFIITTLVQSSSVTMALTLSALNASAIDFHTAAVIVLGSETGTIIKLVLGALNGNVAKKRVAFGNLIFNLFISVVAFIFLQPILYLITDVFAIKDPLIGLVTFSSFINLLAIIIFLPFLNKLSEYLEKMFDDSDSNLSAYISQADIYEPESSLDLFKREAEFFIHNTLLFNLSLFDLSTQENNENPEFKSANEKRKYHKMTSNEKYQFLKQLQGELQAFYIRLRNKLPENQIHQINRLISSVRSAMHSAKSMRSIETNINNLKQSSKDIKFEFFIKHKNETEKLYERLNSLLSKTENINYNEMQEIYYKIQSNYSDALNEFYKEAQNTSIEGLDITTAINFNRELFTSNKAILMAVKDLTLEEKLAEEFNEITVYKT